MHHSAAYSTLVNFIDKLGKIRPPDSHIVSAGTHGQASILWGLRYMRLCHAWNHCGYSNPNTNAIDVSVAILFRNRSTLNCWDD